MQVPKDKLKQLLVQPGHVSEADFDKAAEIAAKKDISLESYLVDSGMITDGNLGQVIANAFDLRYTNLSKLKIDEEAMRLVPEIVARRNGLIAFGKKEGVLKVAMKNPEDVEMCRFLEKRSGLTVQPYFATDDDIDNALKQYQSSVEEVLTNFFDSIMRKKLTQTEKETNIISLVDIILKYAYLNGASDIHFDPVEDGAVLRYRIDGILHDIYHVDMGFVELVVSRIKVLSKMRTDEHRMAQDGKLSMTVEDRKAGGKAAKKKVDVRISVIPTVYGENVVLRLLTADNRSMTLNDLGFSDTDSKKINDAVTKTDGMILVTGPTGSGKTTTLYAILKILNKREVNIATIEDPIEYSIEGITQIQVNPKTNLTFADGLRAIVRQDPNIIMVGEIRDHETADIVVNSAMTGHLVLSTMHTNNAAVTLPRLLDMGIEPFLISSTINIIVAQRLVRKVCENCRTSYRLTAEEKRLLEAHPRMFELVMKMSNHDLDSARLYRGAGCKVCDQTGYIGRMGIFEVLTITKGVKEAILRRASSDEIMELAIKDGMATMIEDGISKAWQGVTTIEEVLRVSSGEYPANY
jgi:type IV pilus assembly protein PilB